MLPLLLALTFQCPDGTPPPCRGVRTPAAPITVAVLPFDNLSRDTNDTYLAQGLTEEITSRLAQVERLTVTSAAVMRHYGGSEDPRRVASSIRVMHLVAGTVRHERQRLRISVELIRGRDGVVAWNRAFDQPDSTLLDIQETIARNVATSITGRLLPSEQAVLAPRRRDPRAYDHYLRGMFALGLRTPVSIRRAAQEFGLALQADSTYGDAIASLSQAYWFMATAYYDTSYGLSRDSLAASSRAIARRALRLDTLSSKAWGLNAAFESDPARQLVMLDRALAIEPTMPEALTLRANLRGRSGDSTGQLEDLRRAIDADPTRPVQLLTLGMQYLYRHQAREALRWLDSAIVFRPEAPYFFSDRAHARLAVGDTAGLGADIAATRRFGNDTAAIALEVAVAARRGDTAAVGAGLSALRPIAERLQCRFNFNCLEIAAALVAAGDHDGGLALIARARGTDDQIVLEWLSVPDFDPIRQDPRFRALLGPAPSRTPR